MPRFGGMVSIARRSQAPERRRIRTGQWVDPFPGVNGTLPEKILYARLELMQIPFIFQGLLTINIPELDLIKDHRPDFIIPGLKLIIEVQGSYWHSKPEALEADAYKFALYQAMGYRVLDWWDYQIEGNLDSLFLAEPALAYYAGQRGGRILTGREPNIDDTKGIATMNRKRTLSAKAPRSRKRNLRRAASSYNVR